MFISAQLRVYTIKIQASLFWGIPEALINLNLIKFVYNEVDIRRLYLEKYLCEWGFLDAFVSIWWPKTKAYHLQENINHVP